jgi:serine/threonine protein phosphatase PrpC
MLLVATDGLFGYLATASIRALTGEVDLKKALESLIDGIRMNSGELPDDVAAIVLR